MDPIRVKMISYGCDKKHPPLQFGNCLFLWDPDETDYDWALVYDEVPKCTMGTIVGQREPLLCHPSQTLFVSQEPESIKLYPSCFLRQFGHVLSTQPEELIRHAGHVRSGGGLFWLYGVKDAEIFEQKEFAEKTKLISVVAAAKRQKKTLHSQRYDLLTYLTDNLPDLDWYGWGVKHLERKVDAVEPYKYHIALENFNGPHHWTEKIAEAFLGLSLPFYAGSRTILEYFPEESLIFIPMDNPPEALRIIQEAIAQGEYEKRLDAIREARKIVLEKYNFYALASGIIEKHHDPSLKALPEQFLTGRHRLRKMLPNLLWEAWEILRYKCWYRRSSLNKGC